MKIKIIGLLLIFTLFSAIAQEENKNIEWNPVEGASEYKIEIMKNNILILENSVSGTTFPVKLNPGDYLYRISVINKFGKISSSSEWVPLTVKAKIQPLIVSIEPLSVNRSRGSVSITIKGFGFQEESQFYSEGIEEALLPSSLDAENGIFQTEIDPELFKEIDSVKIRVVNPSGLEYTYSRSLEFYSVPVARIKKLTPDKAIHNYVETNFVLTGENLSPDSTFYFTKDDDVIYPEEIQYRSSGEISFWLDIRGKEAGNWDLVMEHPEWEKTVKKGNLLQIQRTEKEENEFWKYRNNGTFVFMGFPGIINVGEGSLESFAGMEFKLDLDLMQDSGIGKYAGLEIKGSASLFNGDAYESTSMVYSGAYIRSHLPFPLNFIFRGGMGGRWCESDNSKANGPLVQAGFGLMLTSFDPFIFQLNMNVEAGQRNTDSLVLFVATLNGGFHL